VRRSSGWERGGGGGIRPSSDPQARHGFRYRLERGDLQVFLIQFAGGFASDWSPKLGADRWPQADSVSSRSAASRTRACAAAARFIALERLDQRGDRLIGAACAGQDFRKVGERGGAEVEGVRLFDDCDRLSRKSLGLRGPPAVRIDQRLLLSPSTRSRIVRPPRPRRMPSRTSAAWAPPRRSPARRSSSPRTSPPTARARASSRTAG
jgi:hypothetical protein